MWRGDDVEHAGRQAGTALALSEGGVVRVEDLPGEIRQAASHVAPMPQPALAPVMPIEKSQNALADAEKVAPLQVIQDHHWNMTPGCAEVGHESHHPTEKFISTASSFRAQPRLL